VPLAKIQLRPGINRENTRYTTENGWWDADKIRFRQGTPEVVGGWVQYSQNTFEGVCRTLVPWLDLNGKKYTALGTHTKFFVESGGSFYDITPYRSTVSLTNPFSTTSGDATVTVTDADHGCIDGSEVVFTGGSAVGGLTISGEYTVTVLTPNTYTIEAAEPASSTATGGGTVTASYLVNPGDAVDSPDEGWGVGLWGTGAWGTGGGSQFRLWSVGVFGQDIVFAPRGGEIFTWTPSGVGALSTRGVRVLDLPGGNDVPTVVNLLTVSDTYRFVVAFGCNELGDAELDPLLIRWADQESMIDWTPTPLNQAGGIRLSRGSRIVGFAQTRQEILVLTDAAAYSFQYLGPPAVWGAQLLSSSTTIVGPNAIAAVESIVLWMGRDKFYVYDGQVQPIQCDVLRHIFDDINTDQYEQVFAAPVQMFNEVWWFYPSTNSTVPNKYVIYNYKEGLWSIGSMTRFAWADTAINQYPLAAGEDRILQHETGLNDEYTNVPQPIHAYIESSEFDIEDGDRFSFVRRVIPDITFRNSTAASPSAEVTLYPLKGTGAPIGDSVGGERDAAIVRSATGVVEQYTQQLNIRVRGRQLIVRIESNQLDTTWQAGSMRLDIRPDGQRG